MNWLLQIAPLALGILIGLIFPLFPKRIFHPKRQTEDADV